MGRKPSKKQFDVQGGTEDDWRKEKKLPTKAGQESVRSRKHYNTKKEALSELVKLAPFKGCSQPQLLAILRDSAANGWHHSKDEMFYLLAREFVLCLHHSLGKELTLPHAWEQFLGCFDSPPAQILQFEMPFRWFIAGAIPSITARSQQPYRVLSYEEIGADTEHSDTLARTSSGIGIAFREGSIAELNPQFVFAGSTIVLPSIQDISSIESSLGIYGDSERLQHPPRQVRPVVATIYNVEIRISEDIKERFAVLPGLIQTLLENPEMDRSRVLGYMLDGSE